MLVDFIDGSENGEGGPDGAASTLTKQSHHRIADEFVDQSAVLMDHGDQAAQKRIDEIKGFAGRHAFEKGGEIADIGKHYRNLLFDMVTQFDLSYIPGTQHAKEFLGHEAFKIIDRCVFGFDGLKG